MQIKQLDIYGYGKWVDTSFDLSEGIHLFYGMNEAGKSTLMSFIHSILFGFPTRNSTLLRYEPRESSRYGGRIIAEDKRFGQVIIERTHGKVTGDVTVTLEDGTTGSDEMLETVLHGMTRESYQHIFSFSLTDIENIHKLNKSQLSRYLLNIGAHGTEYYLELADQLRAESDKIYRPSGRVLALNKQLSKLEKQEKKLVDLEKKNANYLSLVEQLNTENAKIEKLERQLKQKEKRLADIVEFKKQWHVFEEINTLEEAIAKVDLPALKKDGHYLLEEYKRDKTNLSEKLQEVQIKVNEAKQALEQAEMIEAYEENKAEITALEEKLPEMIERLRDYEGVADKRNQIQQELLKIEQFLEVVDQPMYPTLFSSDEKEKVVDWLPLLSQIEQEEVTLKQELQALDNQIALNSQQLDHLEASMWASGEFKAVEDQINGAEMETKSKMPVLLAGAGGILFFVLALFASAPINWILGLLGVLAFILMVTLSKVSTPQESNTLLLKEYDKQMVLRKEYEEALGEADVLQANKKSLLDRHEQLQKQALGIANSWNLLLENHHLPTSFSLYEAENIFAYVEELHENVREDQTQTAKQVNLKRLLERETMVIGTVLSLPEDSSFKEKIAAFRQYVSRVKAEIAREQEKLDQLTALRQEEKQLKQQIENTTIKMTNLIETAGVKEEAAFIALYQEKSKVDAKENRLRFLKENAPNHQAYQVLPSRDELELKEASFHQDLEELEKDKNKALREMTNTQVAIENLEKDGTYSEELQAFENQKATAQRLVDDWVSNQVAAWLLTDTLNLVTRDRFVEIMADAETYFRLLTDGEYETIGFKDEELVVRMRSGQVVDVRALSRGTAEPLYVAIRLAYIKNTRDILELPVIMDDPFVNFDEQRRENMYRLLDELSEELQMIYFTFDPITLKYFKKEKISNLEVRI